MTDAQILHAMLVVGLAIFGWAVVRWHMTGH